MRQFIFSILFLIGCSPDREQSVQFRNLEMDFPTVQTLVADELGCFELLGYSYSVSVKDSVIFLNERAPENFGRCLNIFTGKEISKLVMKGNANNEMVHVDKYNLWEDSLLAISGNYPQKLKLYSINDILLGNAPNPRDVYLPDTLASFYFSMIDRNTIFGVSSNWDASSDTKYFLYDGKEVKYFGKLRKELVSANIEPDYSDMRFGGAECKKWNNKLVTASGCALQFEIIDLHTLKTEKNCYYNQIQMTIERIPGGISRSSNADLRVRALDCNENYIYVAYQHKKSCFVLKFDWDFNPVAKYDLGEKVRNTCFSENGTFLYAIESDDEEEYGTIKRYKL